MSNETKAPQPPAEAQGGGEVELRHMVAKLAAHVRPTCGELWAEAERILDRTDQEMSDETEWVMLAKRVQRWLEDKYGFLVHVQDVECALRSRYFDDDAPQPPAEAVADQVVADALQHGVGIARIAPDDFRQPPAEAQAQDIGPEWKPCRKRPVIVHVREQHPGEQHISTREGITPVMRDDLIIRGVEGEEYPIGRELFAKTYDMVLDAVERRESSAPVGVASAAAAVMAVPELQDMACIGSMSPAEHALGLLQQAFAQQPAADKFVATFRCESNGIVDTTNAPIHSVSMHDDGVIEVVIDHWPEQPAAVDEVDWRALYRFQTAMRYMDNNPKLTNQQAAKMADDDIAALAAALAGQQGGEK